MTIGFAASAPYTNKGQSVLERGKSECESRKGIENNGVRHGMSIKWVDLKGLSSREAPDEEVNESAIPNECFDVCEFEGSWCWLSKHVSAC